jgi:hypothetical protein
MIFTLENFTDKLKVWVFTYWGGKLKCYSNTYLEILWFPPYENEIYLAYNSFICQALKLLYISGYTPKIIFTRLLFQFLSYKTKSNH